MISRATDDPTTGRERAFLLPFAPRSSAACLPLIQACKGSRRWRCRTGGSRKGMRAPELSIFQVRDYGALRMIAGEERSALQYDIGNHATASL